MRKITNAGLNGRYDDAAKLGPMSPAKACLTGLAAIISRDNTTPEYCLALRSQLDGLWLGIGPQFRTILPTRRQAIVDGFEQAFLHTYGGDKTKADAAGMKEEPTLVAIHKLFDVGSDGKVSETDGKMGADFIALAAEVAKHGLANITPGQGFGADARG